MATDLRHTCGMKVQRKVVQIYCQSGNIAVLFARRVTKAKTKRVSDLACTLSVFAQR
jgi:tRNA/tmRNA/rRNA uracil-C5-methylase (TrmA/RlmC/RlmD family)